MAVLCTSLLGVAACSPPGTWADGSVVPFPPLGANGLIVAGDSLWLADLFAGQLIRFDPDTGRTLRRVAVPDGISPPDDGVVLADTLVYTSPGDKLVGRVRTDGTHDVVAGLPFAANAIALDPTDPQAVLVGDAAGTEAGIWRVPLDGRPAVPVATGIGAVNSFDIGPDGRVWAPSGGFPSILGSTGGVVRVDLATGVGEPLALSFPDEPGKTGFSYSVAAKFAPDGTFYVLQGYDAGLYRVDPASGEARRVASIPGGVADNLAFLADGRTFVSTFVAGPSGGVVEVHPDGSVRWVAIGG